MTPPIAALVVILGLLAAAGWTTAVLRQRGETDALNRLTAEQTRHAAAIERHAQFVEDHTPLPEITRTQAQEALARLHHLIRRADESRNLTGWVSTNRLDSVVELLEQPPPECTGLTASWCPVHGDCACPRDDDQGQLLRDMSDPACPLHAPDSDHAEDRT